MTQLAIFSDIHADVDALKAALTQVERLGCGGIVCAGDLVGYGRFPEETITYLRKRGISIVRGNHDRWALAGAVPGLSRESMEFLAGLPLDWNTLIEGVRIGMCHGAPGDDFKEIEAERATSEDVRRWLENAHADVLIVGHTHVPFALQAMGGGLIVNPGTILRTPPSGETVYCSGTFGVLELPSQRFTVHRIADGGEVEIRRMTAGIRDLRRFR